MIRGKKNFLPPNQLVYGFGFLFKLDESSIPNHADERRVRSIEDDEKVSSESIAEAAVETVAEAPAEVDSKESSTGSLTDANPTGGIMQEIAKAEENVAPSSDSSSSDSSSESEAEDLFPDTKISDVTSATNELVINEEKSAAVKVSPPFICSIFSYVW